MTDLKIAFASIKLPETIEFGDMGQATVTVINWGTTRARGPVGINLYISTDTQLDLGVNPTANQQFPNDVLLQTTAATIDLAPGESQTFIIHYATNTSAIAPGAYHLLAQANFDGDSKLGNNLTSLLVSAPNTDMVIDWNATALNAIQAEGKAGRGVPPTLGSRLLAITSAAVYDVVNAFEQTHIAYAVDRPAPRGASRQAAVVGAAYHVLKTILPGQRWRLNAQKRKSLNEITDSRRSEVVGFKFGVAIADQLLALRTGDGSENNAPYAPPAGNYVWREDISSGKVAVGPKWGKIAPFAIPSVEQFAPNGLDGRPDTNPARYAQEIEEVRQYGGRENTDTTLVLRDADQTELTFFWAYDRADTFRPYGQLNQIAQEIAIREGNSLMDNARLFAQLNIALADAAIVAWNSKYQEFQPRPDDLIAGGFAANDGIPETIGDPDWRSLLPTPPFPDYISGHSTFGGAFAGVMTNFFGDNYRFTAVSQELPGVLRTFNNFMDAANEDALSRIYGGVHVREATTIDAVPVGFNIGSYVATQIAQPIGATGR